MFQDVREPYYINAIMGNGVLISIGRQHADPLSFPHLTGVLVPFYANGLVKT